jgi:hypothetical protein
VVAVELPQDTDQDLQTANDINLPSVNWTNTPLYRLYDSKEPTSLAPSDDLYQELEVDDILE